MYNQLNQSDTNYGYGYEEEKPDKPCCLPKRDGEQQVSDGNVWQGRNGDWVLLTSLTPGANKKKK